MCTIFFFKWKQKRIFLSNMTKKKQLFVLQLSSLLCHPVKIKSQGGIFHVSILQVNKVTTKCFIIKKCQSALTKEVLFPHYRKPIHNTQESKQQRIQNEKTNSPPNLFPSIFGKELLNFLGVQINDYFWRETPEFGTTGLPNISSTITKTMYLVPSNYLSLFKSWPGNNCRRCLRCASNAEVQRWAPSTEMSLAEAKEWCAMGFSFCLSQCTTRDFTAPPMEMPHGFLTSCICF